jgi:hypothetical protein
MVRTYGIDVEAFFGSEDLFLVRRHARRPRYRCPFVHHEHDHVDPGFVVDLWTGLWCCHKCPGDSAGPLTGNLITFVERRYDLDRAAARAYLMAHHGASFGRRVEPDPENPFSPAARRARGQVVSGKKPGSTRFALRIKERNVQQAALGQKRLKLRRWIESEFGVGKRYANHVIRTMLDEELLFEVDGDLYGAVDDARAAEGSLSFLDEANCPPSFPGQEIAHPVEHARGLIAHPALDILATMARLMHVRVIRETIESDRDGLRAGRFTSERDLRVVCLRNVDRARDLERVLAHHIDDLRAPVASHA